MQPQTASSESPLVRDGVVEAFWAEFVACWHKVPNKGLFLGLLGAWVLLFHVLGNATFGYFDTSSLLGWLYRVHIGSVSAEERGPGMLAPILVLFLFWVKRKELLAIEMRTWAPAMVLFLAALLLHMFGYIVQQPRVSIVALFVGIYALMGLAWGPNFMVRSFFPYVLMVFMMPWHQMATVVTFPLRVLATTIVEFIARDALGMDVVREGSRLFDPTPIYDVANQAYVRRYEYDVAPACSGLRSVTAMIFIAAAYGYWVFRATWRSGVFLLAAIPLAVVGNVVRLLCIVVAAELGGKEWGDWVHDSTPFSMLPYVPVIIGLIWLGGRLEQRQCGDSAAKVES